MHGGTYSSDLAFNLGRGDNLPFEAPTARSNIEENERQQHKLAVNKL